MKKKLFSLGIAALAAASFALISTSASAAHATSKKVKCYGVCKSKSACKGKDYMMLTKSACEKKGGTTTAPTTGATTSAAQPSTMTQPSTTMPSTTTTTTTPAPATTTPPPSTAVTPNTNQNQ